MLSAVGLAMFGFPWWPFKRRESRGMVYPFRPFIEALKDKDEELYGRLCHLPVGDFWREWKKVYPEDFPEGGASYPGPSSIMPRDK